MGEETAPVQIAPRYKQLDSLRGVAALSVLFCHYQLIFKIEPLWVTWTKMSPFGILVNGRSAVMFFFVLSGFVLSLPFVNNGKPLKLTTFYIKRIFRIYPAWLFTLIFAIVLKIFIYDRIGVASFSDWLTIFWDWSWNSGSYKELIKSVLLVGPAFNSSYFDPVIWSLVVEMQMSIVLPFFIIIASRSNWLFNLLFTLVINWVIYYNQAHYLGVFYIGVLCAKYCDVLVKYVKRLNRYALIAVLLTALFLFNIHFEFFVPEDKGASYGNLKFFCKDYLTALGGAMFLIAAIASTRLTNLLQNRFFTFMGDISYSFYLLHLPILITACSVFSSRFTYSSLYIFISALLLSVVISAIVFRFIEKPFQQIAKKLVTKSGILNALNLR